MGQQGLSCLVLVQLGPLMRLYSPVVSLRWWQGLCRGSSVAPQCGLSPCSVSFSRASSRGQSSLQGDSGLPVPGLSNTWAQTTWMSLPPHSVGQAVSRKQVQAPPLLGGTTGAHRVMQNCWGHAGEPLAQVLLTGTGTQVQGAGIMAVLKC